jgi:hypothetical protein
MLFFNAPSAETYKEKKTKETIRWLYKVINTIFYTYEYDIIYEIRNNKVSYIDKHTNKLLINVIIWDDTHNRPYDNTFLLLKIIQQLSISLEKPNSSSLLIYQNLIDIATMLGYIQQQPTTNLK